MKKILFMACCAWGALSGVAMASGENQNVNIANEANARISALNADLPRYQNLLNIYNGIMGSDKSGYFALFSNNNAALKPYLPVTVQNDFFLNQFNQSNIRGKGLMSVNENAYLHAFVLSQYIKNNYSQNSNQLGVWAEQLANIFFPGVQAVYDNVNGLLEVPVNINTIIVQVIEMLNRQYNPNNLQTIAGMFSGPQMVNGINVVNQTPFLQAVNFSWQAVGVTGNSMLETVPLELLELCQQVYRFMEGAGIDPQAIQFAIDDSNSNINQLNQLQEVLQQINSQKNSVCNIF